MAAVDCIPMASRYHPHHPFNQPSRRSSGINSNNPYARYMSPSPSVHSRRSVSEVSALSAPSIRWSGVPEHHPVEPRRRHNHSVSSVPQRRRTRQTFSRDSQLVNPDIIDELDNAALYSYHHEGPYDAVYPERNRISKHSPVEAVRDSNEAALRATPRHKIADSLSSHRPLDGTAFYPPGVTDREGHTYDYEEGSNFMNEYGNFMRLPGKKFTDEDFKNDPFYNRPIPNPFAQLRKKLSLRRHKQRRSTA